MLGASSPRLKDTSEWGDTWKSISGLGASNGLESFLPGTLGFGASPRTRGDLVAKLLSKSSPKPGGHNRRGSCCEPGPALLSTRVGGGRENKVHPPPLLQVWTRQDKAPGTTPAA